jgi:glyoxylase-like metal-dependent hydrolase (beta-lactamase superfamily II)
MSELVTLPADFLPLQIPLGASMRRLMIPIPGLAIALSLAASASVQAQTLQASAAALNAATTKSIEFSGSGRWFQFGQAPNNSSAWPPFDVSRYVAAINFETSSERVQIRRIQVVEPGRVRPAPVEQKADQYLNGSQAWNLAPGPNPAQDAARVVSAQPGAVDERTAEILATPQGFLRAALANNATTQPAKDGIEVSFTVGGRYRYVGNINAANQVERVQTWIATPVLGDTLVETKYSDYKDFGGVQFPGHIARSQGGYPVLDLTVSEVRLNPTVYLPVPQEVLTAKAAPVTATALAEGVYYLTGGTHHSVAIEQRDHIVLIEAPLNEERSLAIIAKLKETIPNKPIKFVVNTHAHFDHSGGLRTFVDEGATIVTEEANAAYYEKVWSAARSIDPDRLAKSKKSARFDSFTGKHVLSDGKRAIEIHPIGGSGHNDAFDLVYLPAEKILIEADAYTPTAANVPPPKTANPYTVNLYDNIQKLKLDVTQIAALHGPRVVTLADLGTAIGKTEVAKADAPGADKPIHASK